MGWSNVRSLAEQVKSATADFERTLKALHERFAKRVTRISKNMLLAPKLIEAGIPEGQIEYLTEYAVLDELCIDLGRRSDYAPGEFVARMRKLREVLGQMKLSDKSTYGLKGDDVKFTLSVAAPNEDVSIEYIDVLPEGARCKVQVTTRTITERAIVCEKPAKAAK